MKKTLKSIIAKVALIAAFVLCFSTVSKYTEPVYVYAGFGDLNDYSGGGGGGWDSDWSSSDDRSADYKAAVIAIAVVIIIIYIIFSAISDAIKKKKDPNYDPFAATPSDNSPGNAQASNSQTNPYNDANGFNNNMNIQGNMQPNPGIIVPASYAKDGMLPDRTAQIDGIIKAHDPNFTAPDFISFAKQVYIDIQNAWSNRNLEPVMAVLHQNLYQMTDAQVKKKIQDGIVNHLEKINVNTAYISTYRRDAQYEYIGVYLASGMIDYQVQEATGKIIMGDKRTIWNLHYKMIFMRSVNVKTKSAEDKGMGHVCPCCGAPLKGTSFGKCEYCGNVVTTGMYSWVLSDFGVIKNDTVDEGIQV